MEKTITLDDDTAALLETVRGLLRDLRTRGLDDETIEKLIMKDGLGRIMMDDRGLVHMPDYGITTLYLSPIERTLYILLMRHEDGIPATDMWKYYDELCAIYRSQTVYDDPDRIESAVDTICEDSRAALHITVSRIKRKFVDKAGRVAAEQYAIVRNRDGVYKIAVPRGLATGF